MPVAAEISQDGRTVTIRISGRFDFSSQREFRKAYELGRGPDSSYVIDMSHTEYMDSSALGMLLLLRDFAGGDRAGVRLVHCNPQIAQILKIANFSQLFDIS